MEHYRGYMVRRGAKLMQIKSKNDSMYVDYYPIMTPTKKLLDLHRLRVITYLGETINKEIIFLTLDHLYELARLFLHTPKDSLYHVFYSQL